MVADGTSYSSKTASDAPPRLLDLVRSRIRFKRYSLRPEQAYVDWIRRYVRFHGTATHRSSGTSKSSCT
jgi:hypothetical protein